MCRHDVLAAGELGHDIGVATHGAQMRLKLWNTRCVAATSAAATVGNMIGRLKVGHLSKTPWTTILRHRNVSTSGKHGATARRVRAEQITHFKNKYREIRRRHVFLHHSFLFVLC